MSAQIPIEDVFEFRRRVWDYAPDPVELLTGQAEGPHTIEECAALVQADLQAEVDSGQPSDFARRWASSGLDEFAADTTHNPEAS